MLLLKVRKECYSFEMRILDEKCVWMWLIVEMKSGCESGKWESDWGWNMLRLRCDWNCNCDCNWEWDCDWFNEIDVLIVDWIYGDGMVVYWLLIVVELFGLVIS